MTTRYIEVSSHPQHPPLMPSSRCEGELDFLTRAFDRTLTPHFVDIPLLQMIGSDGAYTLGLWISGSSQR